MNYHNVIRNAQRFLDDLEDGAALYGLELHPNHLPIYIAGLEDHDFHSVLPPRQWEVLNYFLVEGLRFSEISEKLGLSNTVARTYYQLAVGKISRALATQFMRDMPT